PVTLRLNGCPVRLTPEQDEVFEDVRGSVSARPVQTVGGYAGTGKTVLVAALAEALAGFAVCAFTGKAAHVLRGQGAAAAATIHWWIYRPRERAAVDAQGRRRVEIVWELKDAAEVPCDGFLVDEASMVSQSLHDDLLSFRRPCVFVGDHGQLPPVGSDVH